MKGEEDAGSGRTVFAPLAAAGTRGGRSKLEYLVTAETEMLKVNLGNWGGSLGRWEGRSSGGMYVRSNAILTMRAVRRRGRRCGRERERGTIDSDIEIAVTDMLMMVGLRSVYDTCEDWR